MTYDDNDSRGPRARTDIVSGMSPDATSRTTLREDPNYPGGPVMIGWPRPVYESERHGRIPHAWVADVWDDLGPDPVQYPSRANRASDAIDEWLCQVCGEQCPPRAYAPVVTGDYDGVTWPPTCGEKTIRYPAAGGGKRVERTSIDVSGGPCCSMRCSLLAVSWCPHFTGEPWAVIGFDRTDTEAFSNSLGYESTLNVKAWSVERSGSGGAGLAIALG